MSTSSVLGAMVKKDCESLGCNPNVLLSQGCDVVFVHNPSDNVLVAKEEENTNIIIADSEDKVIVLAFKPNVFFLVQ